jgi:LL-diaminopimelate aminotransferase
VIKFNNGFSRLEEKYLFMEMVGLAHQKRGKGIDIIDMGMGDPDIPTPWPIMDAATNELDPKTGRYHKYPSPLGMRELRVALAEYYNKRFPRNDEYAPENFVVGAGAKTDLFDLVGVFADPGDKILLFSPVYPVAENRSLFNGLDIIYLSATKENDFTPLPSGQFKAKELDDVTLAYVCYPNNPTGATVELPYLRKLVNEAVEHDVAIIYDNAYSDFCEKPFAPSILQVPGAEEVAIELNSFSKPYSMTGWRLSWVCAFGEILKKWIKYKGNRDSGTSNYLQVGGVAALTDPRVPRIVKKNMRIYAKRAKRLEKGFNDLGLECNPLQSTPYAWSRIPTRSTSREFCRRVLSETGVLFTPGSGFGFGGEGYFRATVFQSIERIEETIERIRKLSP